ncbi:hypothetical protein F5884DRAFT_129497 [Xylogone sp. PMI_703]|nr:hypothetical protein F5884DRAFT_129497 [Xylogone sp. PMI_703]
MTTRLDVTYSETSVITNCVSPGLYITELSCHVNLMFWFIIAIIYLLVGRTAEEGSRTLLHGATVKKESHGRYLTDREIKELKLFCHLLLIDATIRE